MSDPRVQEALAWLEANMLALSKRLGRDHDLAQAAQVSGS